MEGLGFQVYMAGKVIQRAFEKVQDRKLMCTRSDPEARQSSINEVGGGMNSLSPYVGSIACDRGTETGKESTRNTKSKVVEEMLMFHCPLPQL